jgi:hypothetical protein
MRKGNVEDDVVRDSSRMERQCRISGFYKILGCIDTEVSPPSFGHIGEGCMEAALILLPVVLNCSYPQVDRNQNTDLIATFVTGGSRNLACGRKKQRER